MTDKPTIEDLRTLRRNLPSKRWYGSGILGILLDDLIERREAVELDAATPGPFDRATYPDGLCPGCGCTVGLGHAIGCPDVRPAGLRVADGSPLLAEIGGAVIRAAERLAASSDMSASAFTVVHPGAGLVTVRVSLRGGDEAMQRGKR